MAFLDQHPGLGYPAAVGLGLLLGSFLNVVILRLPKRLEWEWKRDAREVLEEPDIYEPPPPGIVVEPSHCPHCKHKLSWYENIPLFSWLVLRGKCRHCHAPISIQYPLVELLTAVLVAASVWQFGFGWQGFGAIVLSCFLVALSGIDLRTQLLPDQLTLPLMWLGLIAASDNLYMPAKPALLGALAGYLSLWSVWWLFKQLTGKEGMGHGAGRAGRLVWAQGHPADYPAVVHRGRHRRLDLAVLARPRPGHADSVRALSGHCRLDRLHVGRAVDQWLPELRRPALRAAR